MMLATYFERQISRNRSGRMATVVENLSTMNVKEPMKLPNPNEVNRHPLSCAICRDKYKNPKCEHSKPDFYKWMSSILWDGTGTSCIILTLVFGKEGFSRNVTLA
ncbi:unnamed protein product [Allacma fusca]|uniref:Uncharacterized protein n=1 Tax=Allacma fusca TaxID=39272 RepID=A0A8J2P020_9HEXA|nr:unnamed protein product [Allacma fusca]